MRPFSDINADVHAHLIPGIDDGPPDMESALRLVRGLADLGYRRLTCTPHVYGELYPNNRARILEAFARFQAAVMAEETALTLHCAAEYMLDDHFDRLLQSEEMLCLSDQFVLVETSMLAQTPGFAERLFRLQAKGYTPVIAHPERYLWLQGKLPLAGEWIDKGYQLQVNLLSLTGYYGDKAKRLAADLIQKGWGGWLGTDLHHEKHLALLQAMASNRILPNLLKKHHFKNTKL